VADESPIERQLRARLAVHAGQQQMPTDLPDRVLTATVGLGTSAAAARRRSLRSLSLVGATAVVATVALGVGLAVTARNDESHGAAPVSAPLPVAPPSLPAGVPICAFPALDSGATDAAGSPLVTVDARPTSVTAIWLPGPDQPVCVAQTSRVDGPAATALAGLIRDASAVGDGTFNCPADHYARVRLYFAYPGRAEAEVIEVSLTGCRFISAPGRAARQTTSGIRAALRSLAPDAYQAYLAP